MPEKLSDEHRRIMAEFFTGCTSGPHFTKVAHFFADSLTLMAAGIETNLEEYPNHASLDALSAGARGYVKTRLEDELGAAALIISLCGFLVSDSTGGKLEPADLQRRVERVFYQIETLAQYMLENGEMMAVDKQVAN